jgi:hypothetical protein
VEAFLLEQVAGEEAAEVLATESKGELTETQIEKLAIPDEDKAGILSVEELEVEYATSEPSPYMEETLNKSKKVKVYIIKYEKNWKYFSPAPIKGDTITKSYYDSVFDLEKYSNCTVSNTMTMSMDYKISYGGETETLKMATSMTQYMRFAEGKIYFEQTLRYSVMGESESQKIYAYLEPTETGTVCYVKADNTNGEWVIGDITMAGVGSLKELTPFYDQQMFSYTYFTKTDYGFEIADENARLFLEETFAQDSSLSSILEMLNQGMSIDMFAKFYVSNGVLSGMREDVTLKMDVKESGASVKCNAYVKYETSCKDYGTTVVTKPFSE